MATIQKRTSAAGETSYRVMVRLKGFPAQYQTFKRKTDAKRWGQQTEAAIREGRFFAANEARKHTLSEAIERYRQEVLEPKSPRAREDPERHLRWWHSQIGALTLADVTPPIIAEQRGILAAGQTHYGKRRSPSTVNRYLASLSHLFTIAVREWGWLVHNPSRNVRKLKEPRGRVRFLSPEERERLLNACRRSRSRRLYPLVVAALSTGARRGELLSLRWPDVDLERGVAVVHYTKNGERRALPLAGHALELFGDLWRTRELDSDFVFSNRRGMSRFPRQAWDSALRHAGLQDFRFHDLRHSAASYLAMSGATLAELAEVLGHKTLQMVKRYSHLTEQHTSSIVARMNEEIFG